MEGNRNKTILYVFIRYWEKDPIDIKKENNVFCFTTSVYEPDRWLSFYDTWVYFGLRKGKYKLIKYSSGV